MRKLSRGYSWYSNCIQIFFVFCSKYKYEYIYSYIYTYIVCLFTCYPNKTLFRGFISSLFKKLQLGFSLASFWVSCNVPHSSLSLHCRLISISLQGFEGHSPHLFLSLSPFRLQQQQLWNINAASWTQSASKSQKLSRCCNTLKAAGSYSLQPAASPWFPYTFIVTFTLRSSSCVTHTADSPPMSSHSSKKARIMPHWNSHNATSQANYDKNYSNNNSNKSCATYMKTISIKICASFLTGKSDEAVEQAEEELVDNDERKQFVCPSDAWLIFYKHKLLFLLCINLT